MTRPSTRRVCLLLLFPALAAGIYLAAEFFTAPPVRITVIGTNDMHGTLWPGRAFWREESDPGRAGGFSALAYRVNRIREENDNVLLLDAGDFFQGTPEGNLSRGEIPLLAMNYLGYAAVTLGNHEFDFGVEPVVSLARQADFPFLAANLSILEPGRAPFFRDSVIVEIAGVRILVIGVINQDLFATVEADLEDELAVEPVEAAVRRVLEETVGEWDISLVLSHAGLEGDRKLAEAVAGIDIILGGHSHTGLEELIEVNSTLIGQTYGKTSTAAVLGFDLSPGGSISNVDYRLIELDYDGQRSDPAMELLLRYVSAEIRGRMDVAIARSPKGLSRGRDPEFSPLGSFVADVIREEAGADFAFCNRAGIRNDLPAGPVTRRDIFEILPFSNRVVAMDLTGAEVGELIAHLFGWGGFGYDFSEGVMITVDPEADPKEWVTDIRIGGRPLQLDRVYRVATNSYLVRAIARRRPPGDPLPLEEIGVNVRDAVEAAVAREEEFNYSPRSRVVMLEKSTPAEVARARERRNADD